METGPSCDYCGTPIDEGDLAFFPRPGMLVCTACYERRVARWRAAHGTGPATTADLERLFTPPGEGRKIVQATLF